MDSELDELNRELEVVAELSRKAIYENAHVAINQSEWPERNNGYLERHRKALERVTYLEDLMRERQSKSLMLDSFIQNLSACKTIIKEFDDRLWMIAINDVIVQAQGDLIFRFKDGTEISK
jgi:hypothetical protein